MAEVQLSGFADELKGTRPAPQSVLPHHSPLASPHTPPPTHTSVWAPALYQAPEVILLGGCKDK